MKLLCDTTTVLKTSPTRYKLKYKIYILHFPCREKRETSQGHMDGLKRKTLI